MVHIEQQENVEESLQAKVDTVALPSRQPNNLSTTFSDDSESIATQESSSTLDNAFVNSPIVYPKVRDSSASLPHVLLMSSYGSQDSYNAEVVPMGEGLNTMKAQPSSTTSDSELANAQVVQLAEEGGDNTEEKVSVKDRHETKRIASPKLQTFITRTFDTDTEESGDFYHTLNARDVPSSSDEFDF